MVRPSRFLRTPEMTPRTEWVCQPVALTISAMLAPLACRSSSTSLACMLPARVAGEAAAFPPLALRPPDGRAGCRRAFEEDDVPVLAASLALAPEGWRGSA